MHWRYESISSYYFSLTTEVANILPSHHPVSDESYLKAVQAAQNNPNVPPPSGKSPGPIITPLDDKDLAALSATNRPPHDEPEHVVCKHCKKPVIKVAAVQHVKACLRAKTEKAKERKKAKEAAAAAALAASKGVDAVDTVKEESAVAEAAAGSAAGGSTGGKSLPGEAGEAEGKLGSKKKGAKKMAAKKGTGEPKKTKKQKALEGTQPPISIEILFLGVRRFLFC